MSIGDRIREERERLGFNQIDFGEAGKVGRKSQFNYESGDRFPDALYLADIAEIGADVLYVVTGIRSDTALSPDERQLLSLFRTAPLTGKAAAVGALQGAIHSSATSNTAKNQQNVHGGNASQFNAPTQHFEGSQQVFKRAPTGDIAGRDIVKKARK